jgi:hypothetical protein
MEGEGEDDDADHDEIGYGKSPSHAEAPPRKDDPTRAYIRPPSTARKVEWLKVFLDQDEELDEQVKNQLWDALAAEDPATQIADVLRQNPDEREAWFVYRASRVHEMIDEWLAAQAIEPVDPPPWHH